MPGPGRHPLLPGERPVRFIEADGTLTDGAADRLPDGARLLAAYRAMVVGRRFDQQATALAKQGQLAVYPSAHGQEACQIAAALALREDDWLFPTYRDCVAVAARGVDPVETLTLMRGDWHCGYDPVRWRTAPQATPLATQAPHAVGVGHAARLRGEPTVALVLIGDGATSEGDFHEALNFAAVFRSPVVFLIQNNGFAISVPLEKQSAAPSLAYKGIGYGIPSEQVDGNDAAALLAVLDRAVARARAGEGPTLVEAHTYRMGPHSSADDPSRYRDPAVTESWVARDPLARLEAYLRGAGLLSDAEAADAARVAEERAADLRERLVRSAPPEAGELFRHVRSGGSARLTEQAALLAAEMTLEEGR
ncbi:thiamine pyrophosphate-dependent enzyme [Streptomyces sp. NPDC101118]|uniref:thiamine pyrophosphate-dependent enzyme n=1 Tax=Streptomyces sp. NPDC101118 TaxID=3366109 RepID=UPI0038122A52